MSVAKIDIRNYPFVRRMRGPRLERDFTVCAIETLEDVLFLALTREIYGLVPRVIVLWSVLRRWDKKSGQLGLAVLEACGVNRVAMEHSIAGELTFFSSESTLDLAGLCEVADAAHEEAASLGHSWVGSEHLVLALFRLGDAPSLKVLHKHGVSYQVFQQKLAELLPG